MHLATRMRLLPVLCYRLQMRGLFTQLPPDMRKRLKQACRHNAARNLDIYRELQAIMALFQVQHIPVIVLKGAYLAEIVYDNIAVRPMTDLDLLVPVEHIHAASAALTTLGHPSPPANIVEDYLQNWLELPSSQHPDRGIAVELHWTLIPPGHNYSITPDELWARRDATRLAGCEVAVLCAEDLLLHLCGHLSYQHNFSSNVLLSCCDIAAVIEHTAMQLDWDAVIERANRWHWVRGVYLALLIARDWLGAAVPAGVLQALQPEAFDPALYEIVRTKIMNEADGQVAPLTLRTHVMNVLSDCTFQGKIARVIKLVFLPKPRLATIYAVSPQSPLIYLYYVRRCWDLLTRNWPGFAQLLRYRQQWHQLRQHMALNHWLSE